MSLRQCNCCTRSFDWDNGEGYTREFCSEGCERRSKVYALEAKVKGLQWVLSDTQRLTKHRDDLLNGVGAAEQASLCDILSQVKREHIRSKCYVYPDRATTRKEIRDE